MEVQAVSAERFAGGDSDPGHGELQAAELNFTSISLKTSERPVCPGFPGEVFALDIAFYRTRPKRELLLHSFPPT